MSISQSELRFEMNMKKIFLITLLFLSPLLKPTHLLAAEPLVFIVNAQNPVTQLSADEVRNFYFKKKRRWPDDTSVRSSPV